jgi:hypothetical protein
MNGNDSVALSTQDDAAALAGLLLAREHPIGVEAIANRGGQVGNKVHGMLDSVTHQCGLRHVEVVDGHHSPNPVECAHNDCGGLRVHLPDRDGTRQSRKPRRERLTADRDRRARGLAEVDTPSSLRTGYTS